MQLEDAFGLIVPIWALLFCRYLALAESKGVRLLMCVRTGSVIRQPSASQNIPDLVSFSSWVRSSGSQIGFSSLPSNDNFSTAF
jgi:hypothetical protein